MDTLASQQAASDPDRNKKLGAVVQTMTESLYGVTAIASPLAVKEPSRLCC